MKIILIDVNVIDGATGEIASGHNALAVLGDNATIAKIQRDIDEVIESMFRHSRGIEPAPVEEEATP